MNEIAKVGAAMAQAMTIKQVAEALGTAESTIRNKAADLFPDVVVNGKTTYLLAEQVQKIKDSLVPRTLTLKSKVEAAVTELDMIEKARDVMLYLTAKVEEQRAALALAAPKCESFDALMRSDKQLSITDASKQFNLHPQIEVFPYLRARSYLTARDLPTQAAIDAGYLSLKVTTTRTGQVYQQAVIEAWQLENWRAHVVHQIKRFHAEARL